MYDYDFVEEKEETERIFILWLIVPLLLMLLSLLWGLATLPFKIIKHTSPITLKIKETEE